MFWVHPFPVLEFSYKLSRKYFLMIHGVYFDDTVKGEDVSPTVMRR